MMDFSVVSGYVGLWKPYTLLGAFENTLAANGLRNTLSHAKRNLSHVSTLLRQRFVDCIRRAATQQSLSVDYVVPPLMGQIVALRYANRNPGRATR